MKLQTKTQGQGPDLVFLHGWGMHTGLLETTAKVLAQTYKITLVDLPGHGFNHDIPMPKSIDELVTMLLDVAPDTAHWSGWSIGGLIATYLTLNHPTHVEGLTTVCFNPRFTENENWPGAPKESLEGIREGMKEDIKSLLDSVVAYQFLNVPNPTKAIQSVKEELYRQPIPNLEALSIGADFLENIDLSGSIASITCPTLHLHGDKDPLVPNAVNEKIQEVAPHHRCIMIEGAGHMPFITHQDEFVACFT